MRVYLYVFEGCRVSRNMLASVERVTLQQTSLIFAQQLQVNGREWITYTERIACGIMPGSHVLVQAVSRKKGP